MPGLQYFGQGSSRGGSGNRQVHRFFASRGNPAHHALQPREGILAPEAAIDKAPLRRCDRLPGSLWRGRRAAILHDVFLLNLRRDGRRSAAFPKSVAVFRRGGFMI